jgi:hypothetical protein
MNNRFKTDFLCPQSSFLSGMGSVINLRGQVYAYNECEDPDTIAIASDWCIVGQDIRDALEKAKTEFEPIAQNE